MSVLEQTHDKWDIRYYVVFIAVRIVWSISYEKEKYF